MSEHLRLNKIEYLRKNYSSIPDISRFFPATDGTTTETPSENPHSIYSLAIPEPGKFKPTYDKIMGKIAHPHNWTNTKFGSSGKTYSGLDETQIGTLISALEYQDIYTPERLLIPTGLEFLQKGQSVCGIVESELTLGPKSISGFQERDFRIGIYAKPLPDLSLKERADVLAEYNAKYNKIHNKVLALGIAGAQAQAMEARRSMEYAYRVDSGMDPSTADGHYRTYSFDARLLHPEIVFMNPSSPSFENLRSDYPVRVAALAAGFVTVDFIKFEAFPAYQIASCLKTPEDTTRVLLPDLEHMYKIIQMERAGFDVIITEGPDLANSSAPDKPSKYYFSVMIKPKTTTSD